MQLTNAKVSRLVIEATELAHSLETGLDRLEFLKQAIRIEATKASDGELVEYQTAAGVATVCFPRDAVFIEKGANLLELKATLPSLQWDDLFAVEIVLAEEFTAKYERLSASLRKVVKGFVRWDPRAPRVTLPK